MSTVLKNSVVPVKENTEHRNESDSKGHILNITRFNKPVRERITQKWEKGING